MNSPARTLDVNPIDLRDVARHFRYVLLQANSVAQRQTLQQAIYARCLLDTRDKVLSGGSDDDWLEEGWSD